MQIAKLNAQLVASAPEFAATFSAAERNVKSFAATSQAAGDKVAASTGGFAALKKVLGEESTAGNFLKALGGAGAFAAVGMAANQFAALADKVTDLNNRFATGKITAGDYVAELVKSIPIIGKVADSLANLAISLLPVQQEFLRSQAAMERWRKEAELAAKATAAALGAIQSISKQRQADELAIMPEGLDKTLATAASQYQAKLDEIAAAEKRFNELHSGIATTEFIEARIAAMRRYEAETQAAIDRAKEFNTESEAIRIMQDESQRTAEANQASIDKVLEGLGMEAATAGLDAYQQRVAETRKYLEEMGATAEQVAEALEKLRMIQNQKVEAEFNERMKREESDGPSYENIRSQLSDEGPKLLQAGSVEAASFVARQQRSEQNDKMAMQMVTEQKVANEIAKRQLDAIERLHGATMLELI